MVAEVSGPSTESTVVVPARPSATTGVTLHGAPAHSRVVVAADLAYQAPEFYEVEEADVTGPYPVIPGPPGPPGEGAYDFLEDLVLLYENGLAGHA
jgi:hypothetical protein